MIFNALFLSGLAALAAASPITRSASGSSCSTNKPTPVLPVNGGEKELESPASGTTLKYILLGFGFQNYTCTSPESSATAIGAVAMLYDITPLYPGQSPNALSIEAFNQLGERALWENDIPLNVRQPPEVGADPSNPFPEPSEPLDIEGLESPLAFAGHHFFNAAGIPQFVASGPKGDINFIAKKLDGIDAPASADPGPDSTGAVAWLYLGANEGAVGASYIYRVITSGGNAHGCASGAAVDSTSYTTQYWVYA